MTKQVKSLRNAPRHVKQWWSRTNLEWALLRMVSQGHSWEAAHELLVALYQRWWDRGRRGRNPLARLHNRAVRLHVLARVAEGHDHIVQGNQVALRYGPHSSSSFVLR